jgi:hypothetical protein
MDMDTVHWLTLILVIITLLAVFLPHPWHH